MPPVKSDAWRTSLVPATIVPVPPSTAVAPRRVPTGPVTISVGSGRGGRSCALPTAGHTNNPPKTAAAKLKPNEFLGRIIVASLFSVSPCLEQFSVPPPGSILHYRLFTPL